MSRIGRQPVALPKGVDVKVESDRRVTVKGPKGSLSMPLRPEVAVDVQGSEAQVAVEGGGPVRELRASRLEPPPPRTLRGAFKWGRGPPAG